MSTPVATAAEVLPGTRWINRTRHVPTTATVVRISGGGQVVVDQEWNASGRSGRGKGAKRSRQRLPLSVFLVLFRPVGREED